MRPSRENGTTVGYGAHGHFFPGAETGLARCLPGSCGRIAHGPPRAPHQPRAHRRDRRPRRRRRLDPGDRRRRRGCRLRAPAARQPGRRPLHRHQRGARGRRFRRPRRPSGHRSDRRLDERQTGPDPPRAVDRGGRGAHHGRRGLRLRLRPRPGRGVVRDSRRGRLAQWQAPGRSAAGAPRGGRAPRASGGGVGRSALAGRLQRVAGARGSSHPRHGLDRHLAVPGGRDPRGRDGHPVEVPRGRRGGGAAHRSREWRPRRVHGDGRPAGRAPGPRAALTGRRRALATLPSGP